MSTKNMIKITNLQKYYRTEEVETVALNNLNIHVKEGEFVAVMGPSGCGKSTLLNIIGLLDDLDEGSYLVSTRMKLPNSKNRIAQIFVFITLVLYFRASI